MYFFFIFHKHPILSCRYFVKKRRFCQNYNTWWAIKVHKIPFFSNSSRKNRCSHTHILSQVRLFSKEHTVLMFMFYEKTSFLSKTMCSHVILSLMDWNEMERKRVSLLNGFLTLFYLPIDLALLYRLSPPLYSVDAKIEQIVTLKYIRRNMS